MRLKDKVALITGSASGMGRVEALAYAKEGAKIVLADMNLEGIQEVANEIKESGQQALAIKADITCTKDINNLIVKAKEQFGTIDILVNNAGVFDKY